jgi:hypothetical protein
MNGAITEIISLIQKPTTLELLLVIVKGKVIPMLS